MFIDIDICQCDGLLETFHLPLFMHKWDY